MRKLCVLALALFAGAALAGPADQKIKSIHDQFAKAAVKNDAAAFVALVKKYMTEDFQFSSPEGTKNRDQWIAQMQTEMKASHIVQFKFALNPSKPTKDGVTLKSTLLWSGTGQGPDGKKHTFTGKSSADEAWVTAGDSFKCKSIKEGKATMTMDGKPFNPMAPPPPKKKIG